MTFHESMAVPRLAKLRVSDFLLLADAGVFENNTRTELIEGQIWVVNAIHTRHARAHSLLTGELWVSLKAMGSPLVLYTAPSTELSEYSLPEPDIVVGEASVAKTFAGDLLRIAIEISDSTLDMDMGRKARLYAKSGVPEYWVVDVEAGVIRQMWAPAGESFGERRDVPFHAGIASATVPGLAIAGFSLA